MKKIHQAIILLILSAFFTSCEIYESPVPISDSSKSTMDTSLVGHYKVIYANDYQDQSKQDFASIMQFNDREYLVRLVSAQDTSIKDILLFKLFNSNVKSKEIFNLGYLEANNKLPVYSFLTYKQLNKDSLGIAMLQKSFSDKEFDSSKKLRKYMTSKYDSLDLFFEPYCTFVKVDDIVFTIKEDSNQ